jgi:sulfide:quinone oxidoreductase
LLTADRAADAGRADVELRLVTPEEAPLLLLGREASDAVADLLEQRGVEVLTGVSPDAFEGGKLRVAPGNELEADRVVSLPRLRGVPLAGVPQDDDFFIPTDPFGRFRVFRMCTRPGTSRRSRSSKAASRLSRRMPSRRRSQRRRARR